MTPAEQIADEVLRLYARGKPPTRAQLVDTIAVMLDVVEQDLPIIVPPPGTVVQPQPGANVTIMPDMSLQLNNWRISSPRPLTLHENAIAILDWMRHGVFQSPRT